MNFTKEYTVNSRRFDPSQIDPRGTGRFQDKDKAKRHVEENWNHMFELQAKLYAENTRSLLIILQGMDASGKDGTIRHVMRGLNPQGSHVYSFKAPSSTELDHDFLWRIHQVVPRRGDIGIFNRSQYEDVLITRVHNWISKKVCKQRYTQINQFEKNLTENGTTILKFFLHISKKEQKERFMERLSNPLKRWKYNEGDLKERAHWNLYQKAYRDVFKNCHTPWAPWFIIPADRKWLRNYIISNIVIETLEKMNPKIPRPNINPKKIKILN